MAPPPSASLPLSERVLALAKTLQCKSCSFFIFTLDYFIVAKLIFEGI